MLRKLLYLSSALLLGAGALSGIQASGATFTDSSATTLNIFSAPDWTAPTVAIVDPGYAVAGTVAIDATASDTQSAIQSVQIQRAPHGSATWTSICTDNLAPYSCSWDTTLVAEGDYDLRAIATDAYANAKTSTTVMTTVANTAGVVLDPVLGPVRGTVTLNARMINTPVGASTIQFQASPSGANTWTDVPGCGVAAGPSRTCLVDSTGVSGYWDWRVIGTTGGNTYYDFETHIMVDNTAPTVSLTVPAAPLVGTAALTASASDAHSGMASVTFEYRRSGVPTWSECGVDTSAPYACSLDTTTVSDGTFEFRARAADLVGNTTTTAITTRTVTNGSVDLATVSTAVRGTVALAATWTGPGAPSIQFQYSASASGPWTTICTDSAAPYACNWNTSSLDSQRWYVKATTTVSGKVSEEIQSTIVDNDVPNVALTVPAGTLYSSVQLTATADDTDPNPGDESSGVANVVFEYRRIGASLWTNCATDTSTPYACSLDTRTLTDGTYQFRATATDVAGNVTTTSTVSRTVDNTPWVNVTAPTAGTNFLQGTSTTVTADGYSSTGIVSMQLQYKPSGSSTWSTICTDSSAPYSCSWNTAGVAAGTANLQSVMNRTGGGTTTSASVAVTIEQLHANDVQVTGSASNIGTPGQGDVITLDYSTTVNLGTIKAGWNGSSTAVSVNLNDKNVGTPLVNASDYLSFPAGVNLGQVAFAQGYMASNATATFGTSTMSATTVTSGGRQITRVTITLSARTAGTAPGTVNSTGQTKWTPSSSVTDTFANACLTTTVSEFGSPSDVDL